MINLNCHHCIDTARNYLLSSIETGKLNYLWHNIKLLVQFRCVVSFMMGYLLFMALNDKAYC